MERNSIQMHGASRKLLVRGTDGTVRTQYARCCFTCASLDDECNAYCENIRRAGKEDNCIGCLSRPCESYKPDSQTC